MPVEAALCDTEGARERLDTNAIGTGVQEGEPGNPHPVGNAQAIFHTLPYGLIRFLSMDRLLRNALTKRDQRRAANSRSAYCHLRWDSNASRASSRRITLPVWSQRLGITFA